METVEFYQSEAFVDRLRERYHKFRDNHNGELEEGLLELLELFDQISGIAPVFSCRGHKLKIGHSKAYIIFACTDTGCRALDTIFIKLINRLVNSPQRFIDICTVNAERAMLGCPHTNGMYMAYILRLGTDKFDRVRSELIEVFSELLITL